MKIYLSKENELFMDCGDYLLIYYLDHDLQRIYEIKKNSYINEYIKKCTLLDEIDLILYKEIVSSFFEYYEKQK